MKRGFFIGRTTLDIVYYRYDIPKENEKSNTRDYMTCVGGNACNAAVTYALLGGHATLITAIGESSVGKSLKIELEEYQIEVIDLAEGQHILPFISSILINVENESRTIWGGQPQILLNRKIDIEELIKEAAFIMSDNQFPEMTAEIFRRAKEKNIPTVFDAERWGMETELLLKLSSDVIASAECQSPDNSELFSMMKEKGILKRAVTDGGNPILWEEGESKGEILPPKVNVVDTLGAGDILHGAYCYFKYVEELSFEKAVEMASQVASWSVSCRGPREGVWKYVLSGKGK